MKGIIYYHSNSGNTKLASQYLSHKLNQVNFDLFDVSENPPLDLNPYKVVGFATWTYFLGVPPFFEQFIRDLPNRSGKPAFLLNTFGIMSGQTLKLLAKLLTKKGFAVIAGHSFHTPESYPPYIVKGWDQVDAPTVKELEQFDRFIGQLNQQLSVINAETTINKSKIKIGLFNHFMRPYSIKKARKQMGNLQVDPTLCVNCGICRDVCLYQAIELNPGPVFSMNNCYGCWACFNHCPEKAIFTAKIKGSGHYSNPVDSFTAKLSC